jgi:hypothetical protein
LFFGAERGRRTNVLSTDTVDGYLGAAHIHENRELKFDRDDSENKVYGAFLQDSKGN